MHRRLLIQLLRVRAIVMKVVSFLYGLRYWHYKPEFEALVAELDTPFKINAWLTANVRYTADKTEYWQTPVETYIRRKGDCDDYARFAVHCLNEHKYDASVLMIIKSPIGHATAIFPDKNSLVTICNWGLVDHLSHDISQVTKFWFADCDGWVLFDEDLNMIEGAGR